MEQNERAFRGIWIPAEIWLSKDLKVMEKLFLVEIDSLDNDLNGCYANNNYFSKFFGLSKNRCSEIIKSLKDKGYLTINYTYVEGTKQIEKRFMKVTKKYFTPSKLREAPSELRQIPSEKCEDNNTSNNNTNNNIISMCEKVSKEEVSNVIERYKTIEGVEHHKVYEETRRKAIRDKIKKYGLDTVMEVLDKVEQSTFLTKDKNKKTNIDFIFKQKNKKTGVSNFIEILEDKYKDRQPKQQTPISIDILG